MGQKRWFFELILILSLSSILTCSKNATDVNNVNNTTKLTGNTAIQAAIVSGYQTFQGGLNYPLQQVEATLPPSCPLKQSLQKVLMKRLGAMPVSAMASTVSDSTNLTYFSGLGLYFTGFQISSTSMSARFFEDQAGTKSAGSLSVTYPAGTNITGPGITTAAYPATITISADITAGNLPMKGSGTIVLNDTLGAGDIKGSFSLPATGITCNADLTLNDTGYVAGSATITENGQTLSCTNLFGPFKGEISGNVSVKPQGDTGTIVLSIASGSFYVNLVTPNGPATGTFGPDGLTITFPDGTQETIVKPLGTQPGQTPDASKPTATYGVPIMLSKDDSIYLVSINNNRQILGYRGYTTMQGIFWSSPTAEPTALSIKNPFAMNNKGEILAYNHLNGDSISFYATTTSVPVTILGGHPMAFNDNEELVGMTTDGKPAYWANPSAQPALLNLPADSSVIGNLVINNNGFIAGTARAIQSGATYLAYWTNPKAQPATLSDSSAHVHLVDFSIGVSSNGQQIYESCTYDHHGAYLFDSILVWNSVTAQPIKYGLSAFTPNSINASGEIVGSDGNGAVILKNGAIKEFFNLSYSMIPPGTGWQLDDEGDGINDSGDVIGKGTLNGVSALFYVAPK